MVTLTANPHDVLPPSWDETIVPSLRKRLESESRILTKRLSTISITDEGPLPVDLSQSTSRAVFAPQNHVQDTSVSNGSYPHRPSAIPRPSYSRGGERVAVPLSPPPAEQSRKASSKRQRTRSTPFPFDPTPSTSALPNGKLTNGIPAPTTSGYTSPRVQSPSLGRTTPTPSRIPTVSSRMRSGSQSSQGLGSLNGGKASLPANLKLLPSETTLDSETQYGSIRVKGSSASLARQRIVDERPPFANDTPPKVLQSEFTGRPSSDEERPYQHWYRGDVSRNGGVGEYRVGKRMEMLDIANFGYALRGSAGRTRPYEEPAPLSEKTTVVPRKRAESVSSMERTSIYIDPQDETVTGRVLDEMPLTDLETEEIEYERDQYHHPYKPPTDFDISEDQFPIPNHDNRLATGSTSTLSSRIPTSKSQTRIPQPHPRSNTQKNSTALPPTTTSEPSTPAKANHAERGREPAPANPRTKPASKTKGQKRSKSAADALRVVPGAQSSEYAGLADAVPDTRSPLPRDGNWDEVILPTVARRMGIEYEKEDPMAAAKRRESRVVPAPGTFGYDHTKYKPAMSDEEIPMGEFGQRETTPQVPEDPDVSEPAPTAERPPDESMPQNTWFRRQTMPSAPPFSQYAPPVDQVPLPDAGSRGRRKERQDVPHILVSPPTIDGGSYNPAMQEEEGAGCCKCVVM